MMKQNVKTFWKKLCAGALAACMAGSLMPGAMASAEEGEAAMGRYLESDVTLPESVYPLDIVRTAEGTLRIIGQDSEQGIAMWESGDGGETWEMVGALPEEYATQYFLDLALNPNGGGAGIIYKESGGKASEEDGEASDENAAAGEDGEASAETEAAAEGATEAASAGEDSEDDSVISTEEEQFQCAFVSFDAQCGSVQETPLDGDLTGYVQFTRNGDALLYTHGGASVVDAQTGEVIRTITENDVDSMGNCGSEALVLTGTELQRYDYTTGEPLQRDEALDDALYADGANYMSVTSLGAPIVMTEDEEGRLYYVTQNGIFSHVMEGSVVEQVVDGKLCTLADPSTNFLGLAVLNQSFYVLATVSSGDAQLLKYEYDADVPSTPGQELTIYSLRENDAIRQMAVLFQKQNPDVYVNYEVGMSGEDGVTSSDALRTLNTDILAGNGPDILILDEMSVDTYESQGLLMDLSDVAAEIAESDGLLENVAEAYRTEEGTLPAIPMRFGLMLAAGDPELTGMIDGFDGLEALASQPDAMDAYDIVNLGEILYKNGAGSWKNDDNTINQEKLAEYVKGVKRVSDAYRENASESAKEDLEMYADGLYSSWSEMEAYGVEGDDLAMGIMDLATGKCRAKIGTLTSIIDYSGLVTANKATGACEESLLGVQQSNVFEPYCIFGVLNTSENTETACSFVKYMLSEEGESQSQARGFAVNKKALESTLYTCAWAEGGGYVVSANDSEGNYVELTYVWPTTEESDALYGLMQQADTCSNVERVQHDVVIEELNRCLDGEISEDEAVNSIMQKLNLYLAE